MRKKKGSLEPLFIATRAVLTVRLFGLLPLVAIGLGFERTLRVDTEVFGLLIR